MFANNLMRTNNTTNAFFNSSSQPAEVKPFSIYTFTIIFIIIFILGIVFNALSIVSIILAKAFTTINILIMNLAVADIIYSLGIPLFLSNVFSDSWPFGVVGCRLFFFTDFIGMIVGIFTVSALSVERFYDVADKKKRSEFYSNKFKVLIICVVVFFIWAFAILFSLPMILSIELVEISPLVTTCGSNWTDSTINIFFLLKFIFIFIIPFSVISFSSIRLLLFLKSWKKVALKKHSDSEKSKNSIAVYEKCVVKDVINVKIVPKKYSQKPVSLSSKIASFKLSRSTPDFKATYEKLEKRNSLSLTNEPSSSASKKTRIYSSEKLNHQVSLEDECKIVEAQTKTNCSVSNFKCFSCLFNLKNNYNLKSLAEEFFSTTKPRASFTLTIRKKAIRLVLVIVLMFFIQWIPIWIFQLYNALSSHEIKYIRVINIIITIVSYSNSVANPALYMLFTYNFKRYCQEAFKHLKKFCLR